MTLQEYLLTNGNSLNQVPRLECNDGFNMSVQASEHHYCYPRENNVIWTEVEIGFISDYEETLMSYCENIDKPLETVYSFVPIEIAQQVIDNHGGCEYEPTKD